VLDAALPVPAASVFARVQLWLDGTSAHARARPSRERIAAAYDGSRDLDHDKIDVSLAFFGAPRLAAFSL
jgi:hypothetical protein